MSSKVLGIIVSAFSSSETKGISEGDDSFEGSDSGSVGVSGILSVRAETLSPVV